jgi:mono/diheme cytochrome c family protein
MEEERLQAIGRRLASFNERLANSPGDYVVGSDEEESAEDAHAGGVSLEEGEALYGRNCSSCHGPRGEGGNRKNKLRFPHHRY